MTGGAVLSPCRTYRYTLTRYLGDQGSGVCVFCGLNPSTADESADDPTIRRETDFARRWGYAWLVKVNAYAYRSTDPAGLKKTADPIGQDNDAWIRFVTQPRYPRLFIAVWGAGIADDRERDLLRLLRFNGARVHALKLTKAGKPGHPLYLPKSAEPFAWDAARG